MRALVFQVAARGTNVHWELCSVVLPSSVGPYIRTSVTFIFRGHVSWVTWQRIKYTSSYLMVFILLSSEPQHQLPSLVEPFLNLLWNMSIAASVTQLFMTAQRNVLRDPDAGS